MSTGSAAELLQRGIFFLLSGNSQTLLSSVLAGSKLQECSQLAHFVLETEMDAAPDSGHCTLARGSLCPEQLIVVP